MKLLEGYWREKENLESCLKGRVGVREMERQERWREIKNQVGEVPWPHDQSKCRRAEDTFAVPLLGVLSMICSCPHLPGLLPTVQQGSGVGSLAFRPGGPALGGAQTQTICGLWIWSWWRTGLQKSTQSWDPARVLSEGRVNWRRKATHLGTCHTRLWNLVVPPALVQTWATVVAVTPKCTDGDFVHITWRCLRFSFSLFVAFNT